MTIRVRIFSVVIWVLALGVTSLAQTSERNPTNARPQAQEQSLNGSSPDTVAGEIGLLRKSLQTLNDRLRVITDTLLAPDAKGKDSARDLQSRIAGNLDLLSRAEQRAEVLRKQISELTEKETTLRSRLIQLDFDLRPDSIERVVSTVGTTRTPEMRETRRQVLENERKGADTLLTQTIQNRQRLEDDVRQADAMVARLRLRLFPLIDKEVDKISPN
jgi:hypothetical protein